jgi:HK97 family phage prohead protease
MEITDAPEHRAIPIERIEFRADSDDDNTLHLEGYASTFEPYEMYGGPANYGWIEQLDKRAFDKTLREKPDLHLLINHAGMPLARTKSGTLQLSTDDHGLKVRAQLDKRDPEVQALAVKMERGDMDEMSFAFRVKGQKWESTPEFEDDPQALRTITEVSLHKGDVSVVNWGANPTTHAEVLSAPDLLRAFVECEDFAEIRSDDELVKRALEKLGTGIAGAAPVINIVTQNDVRQEEGIAGATGTVIDGVVSETVERNGVDVLFLLEGEDTGHGFFIPEEDRNEAGTYVYTWDLTNLRSSHAILGDALARAEERAKTKISPELELVLQRDFGISADDERAPQVLEFLSKLAHLDEKRDEEEVDEADESTTDNVREDAEPGMSLELALALADD